MRLLHEIAFVCCVAGTMVTIDLFYPESDADCFTDACLIERCTREEGRQCTDEDLFGVPPSEDERDDTCRPDDTLPPCEGERQ